MDPVEQAMFAHIVAMKNLYDITNSDDTHDETHVTLAIYEYNQTNDVLDQTLVDLIENDKELWDIIKSKGAHKNREYFHTFSKWLRDHRMEVMCDNLEFLTDFAITSKKYRDDIRNARDNLIRQLEN